MSCLYPVLVHQLPPAEVVDTQIMKSELTNRSIDPPYIMGRSLKSRPRLWSCWKSMTGTRPGEMMCNSFWILENFHVYISRYE